MRIGVIGSMQYTEGMMQIRDNLNELGHEAFVTTLAEPFVGKTDEEKEIIKIHQKMNKDAIREFWNLMNDKDAEAVLAYNVSKHDIDNYIGGILS